MTTMIGASRKRSWSNAASPGQKARRSFTTAARYLSKPAARFEAASGTAEWLVVPTKGPTPDRIEVQVARTRQWSRLIEAVFQGGFWLAAGVPVGVAFAETLRPVRFLR
jgi:hypothetical protein